MPQGGIEALNGEDPLSIKAFQYDMVCNGFEIASGGIRNHLPETMVKAFEMVGLNRETVEERFGGLYRAFQYGAPPHGGMAAGIDRVVMLLVGAKNLREITMFPMNQQAVDLLMNAPSEATPTQLRELHLRTVRRRNRFRSCRKRLFRFNKKPGSRCRAFCCVGAYGWFAVTVTPSMLHIAFAVAPGSLGLAMAAPPISVNGTGAGGAALISMLLGSSR